MPPPSAPPRSGGSVRGSPCGEPARLRFTSLRPPPAAAPPVLRFRVRGSAGDQVNRRHTEMCGCRCFLPDLTGFADFRCGGPGRRRTRGVPPAGRSSIAKRDIVRETGGIFNNQRVHTKAPPDACLLSGCTRYPARARNRGGAPVRRAFLPVRQRRARVRIPPISREYVRMAEGVGFEPTWRLAPPSRFRVDPVTATSVPLRAGKAVL